MRTYLKGFIRVRLTGFGTERFLNLCQHHGIEVWRLDYVDNAYEFCMYHKDFLRCRPLVRKASVKLHIIKKTGLPFFLYRYRKRKAFFVGIFLAAVLLYQLSIHIWDIQFTGNISYTDSTLTEFLEANQVTHGMAKNKVVCADIERMIRNQYPDITWVSAQVSGTRLLVQIKENSGILSPEMPEDTPADLVAAKSGVITEMVTRAGIPMVRIGDTVEKGQVLVSGTIPVMNDNQEVVRYEYVRADGDVKARTQTPYKDSFPTVVEEEIPTGRKRQAWYIWWKKEKIGIPVPDPGYALMDRREEVWQAEPISGWNLPLGVGRVTVAELAAYEKTLSKKEAEEKFQKNLNEYFEKCAEKGVEILENHVTMKYNAEVCVCEGIITALEPIGTHQEITGEDRAEEGTEQSDELDRDNH